MKHVHADVIKAWADDTTLVVECRPGNEAAWCPLANAAVAVWHPDYQYRIKPQPKAISWTNIYPDGRGGDPHPSREQAETFSLQRASYVVEIRDDGTAHLHKVEV